MSGAGGAEQRIIVVGAGIIGICCALALRENGFAVTVLDKDGPGQGNRISDLNDELGEEIISPSGTLEFASHGAL